MDALRQKLDQRALGSQQTCEDSKLRHAKTGKGLHSK